MTTDTITARAHRGGRYWVFELDGLGSVGPTGELRAGWRLPLDRQICDAARLLA